MNTISQNPSPKDPIAGLSTASGDPLEAQALSKPAGANAAPTLSVLQHDTRAEGLLKADTAPGPELPAPAIKPEDLIPNLQEAISKAPPPIGELKDRIKAVNQARNMATLTMSVASFANSAPEKMAPLAAKMQAALLKEPPDIEAAAQNAHTLVESMLKPKNWASPDTTEYAGEIIAILKLIQKVSQDQAIKAMLRADMAAVGEAELSIEAAKKEEAAAKARLISTIVSVLPTLIGAAGGALQASKIQSNAAMGGKEALYGQAMGQVGEAVSKLTDSIGNYVAVGLEADASMLRAQAKLDDTLYDHARATAKALDDVREAALKSMESIVGAIVATSKDVANMS